MMLMSIGTLAQLERDCAHHRGQALADKLRLNLLPGSNDIYNVDILVRIVTLRNGYDWAAYTSDEPIWVNDKLILNTDADYIRDYGWQLPEENARLLFPQFYDTQYR